MFAICLCWFWISSITDQQLNQKLWDSYSTELSLGSFDNLPVNKADTMSLLFYKVDFRYNALIEQVLKKKLCIIILLNGYQEYSVIVQRIKRKLCISYFLKLMLGTLCI